MSWYYVNSDGFTVGPKTVAQLKHLYASRKINDKTFVWNGTTVDTWTILKKVTSIYDEVAPRTQNPRHSKRAKSTTKLSVIARLSTSSHKKSTTSSRFASLKPSALTKKNKNNDRNNKTNNPNQEQHTNNDERRQTQNRNHHKSKSTTTKLLKPKENNIRNGNDDENRNRTKLISREPSTSYSVTSVSSTDNNKGRIDVDPYRRGASNHAQISPRPPSLSSINFSTSTAKRTKFLQSQSHRNLLRVHEPPQLYSSVSADDIDNILDEIEHNEQKQNFIAKKIKSRLSSTATTPSPTAPKKKISYTDRILGLIKRDKKEKSDGDNNDNDNKGGTESDPGQVEIDWNEVSSVQFQAENIDAIRRIITTQPNIDVNTQNPRDGTTLLIHAIIIGDLDLVLELLRYGADYKIKDNDGDDAIDYSLIFQRYKITELLLMINKGLNNKRLKEIIRKKERQCRYIEKNTFGRFKYNIIDFICKAIENKGVFEANMLFMAWYFTIHSENKVTGNDTQPHVLESKLFKTMMKVYGDAMRNKRKDKKAWKWIRKYLIESIIWLLPHPDVRHTADLNIDETDDEETDDEDDNNDEEEESKSLSEHRIAKQNLTVSIKSEYNYRGYDVSTSQQSMGSYYYNYSRDNKQLIAIEESQDEYDKYCANSVGLSNKLVNLVRIDQFLNIEVNNLGEDKLLLFLFL